MQTLGASINVKPVLKIPVLKPLVTARFPIPRVACV